MEQTVLEVKNLTVSFHTEKGVILPVNGVTLTVPAGRIVGIVGESGCGKSMTARAIMGLVKFPGKVTGGEILLNGRNIAVLPEKERRRLRGAEISMIFQEPMTSLNPVVKVGKQVDEAVRLHTRYTRAEAKQKTLEMFREVEIPEPETRYNCYPHQFSGGQRQRIGIARAIAAEPAFIVCDEPVSALDVSVQNQILNLLKELKSSRKLTYLFISHDLSVVRYLSDRVCVMFLGKVCEIGPTEEVYNHPRHPYTRFLLDAVPLPDPRLKGKEIRLLHGDPPSPANPPSGCRFRTRCPFAKECCAREEPALREIAGVRVACHFADNR